MKKTISVVLIFTFTYTQLLWAGPRDLQALAKSFFDEEAQRRGMGAEDGINQAAVDHQNLLQSIQGPVAQTVTENPNTFSLTTQNGDILKYIGNTLSQVQRPNGGPLLTNLDVVDGTIQDATLNYLDGSIQEFTDGKINEYTTPDGTKVEYDLQTGRIFQTTKENIITDYTYSLDAEDQVTQTTLETPTHTNVYGQDQKLKTSLTKADGSITYFENGIFQKIVYPDGRVILFQQTPLDADIKVTLDHLSDPHEEELKEQLADLSEDIQEIREELAQNQVELIQKQSQSQNLENERSNTQGSLEDAQSDLDSYNQETESYVASQETHITDLQTQIQSLNTSYQGLLTELSNLDSLINTQIPSQISAIQAQISQVNQDLNEAQTELEAIQASLNDIHEEKLLLEDQISDLGAQITNLQNQITSLQDQRDATQGTLNQHNEELAILQSQRTPLEEELSLLNLELQTLQAAQVQLESQITQQNTLLLAAQEAILAKQTQVDTLNAELTDLLAQQDSKLAQKNILLSEIAVLQSQINDLNAELTQNQVDLNQATQDLTDTQSEIGLTQNELLSLETTKTQTQASLEDINAQIAQASILPALNAKIFNGTTADYINLGDRDELESKGDNFTVTAWIQTSKTKGTILNKKDNSSKGYHLWLNGSGYLEASFYGPGGSVTVKGNKKLSNNAWHHVAVTRQGNVFTLYVDGVQAAQKRTSSALGDASNTVSARIGRSSQTASNGYPFKGSIGDVRIYNQKALTLNEIKLVKQANIPQAQSTTNIYSINPNVNFANLEALRTQKNLLTQTLSQIQAQVTSKTDYLNDLNLQKASLENTITDLESTRTELNASLLEAQNSLSQKESLLANLEYDITILEARIQEKETQIDTATQELQEITDQVNVLQGHLHELEGDLSENQTEQSSIQSLIAQTQADLTANTTAQETLQALITAAEALITDLSDQIISLESEKDQTQTSLNSKYQELATLLTTQTELEETLSSLQSQITSLTNTQSNLSAGLIAKQNELNTVIQTRASKLTESQDIAAQITDKQSELTQAQESLSDYIASADQTAQSLQANIDSLTNQIASLNTQIEALTAQITSLQADIASQQTSLSEKIAQKETLQNELAAYQETLVEDSSALLAKISFEYLIYRQDGSLKGVLTKEGVKLTFDETGLLKEALDAQGNITTSFRFTQSDLLNLTGSNILENGVTSSYDETGKLSSVRVEDMTIHYKDGQLDYVEKEDGTEIYGITFDGDQIQDATIVTPEGDKQIYAGGHLTKVIKADESEFEFEFDEIAQKNNLEKLVTSTKIIYNFDPTPTGDFVANITTAIPDALTITQMEYNSAYKLKKAIRHNSEIINYLSDTTVQITPPNEDLKTVTYQKDEQGRILSTTIAQGNTETVYDGVNNPVQTLIHASETNPHELEVSYSYGKIREVKKAGVTTFRYSYSFDAENNELTYIEDLEEEVIKTYKNEVLMESKDTKTGVISKYSYYEDGKVSKVEATRLGKAIRTYDYEYADGLTKVKDEENIIRTYDSNSKLLTLEKNNRKFAYSYSAGLNGQEVIEERLIDQKINDVIAYYDETGKTRRIEFENGSYLSELDLDATGKIKRGTLNLTSGVKIIFTDDKASRLISSDGKEWTVSHLVDTQGNPQIQIEGYGIKRLYDSEGKLLELTLSAGLKGIYSDNVLQKILTPEAEEIVYGESNLSAIKAADGALYSNLILGTENSLLSADGVFDSGSSLRIENGELRTITSSDGAVSTYLSNRIDRINTASQDIIQFDSAGAINSVTKPDGSKASSVILDEEDSITSADVTYSDGSVKKLKDGLFTDFSLNPKDLMLVTSWGSSFMLNPATHHGGTETLPTYDMNGMIREVLVTQDLFHSGNNPDSGYYSGMQMQGTNLQTPGAYLTFDLKRSSTAAHLFPNKVRVEFGTNDLGSYDPAPYHADFDLSGSFNDWTRVSVPVPGAPGSIKVVRVLLYAEGPLGKTVAMKVKNVRFAEPVYTRPTEWTDVLQPYRFEKNFVWSDMVKSVVDKSTTLFQNLEDSKALNIFSEHLDFINPTGNWKTVNQSTFAASVLSDETVVVQEYSKSGLLETQTKADGSVTLFDERGRPSELLAKDGSIQIQYSYDGDHPSRVYLKNARDTLPGDILEAKERIEAQRVTSLKLLADQKLIAYDNIETQVQDARSTLQGQLSSLQNQYNEVANTEVHGKKAKNQRGDALNQIGHAMDDVRGALADLSRQEADALARLDAEVQNLSNDIDEDSQHAYTALTDQETSLKKEILRQEISPIVYDSYRRILGRDPDSVEYQFWVDQVDYDSGQEGQGIRTVLGQDFIQALKDSIEDDSETSELTQRRNYVSNVKSKVTQAIESYLNKTREEKEAYAASLGLSNPDLIDLTIADWQKVKTWLSSRTLHFGQSAFLSLEALLDQKGISYAREDIAEKSILIDILSGVISPLDDGDLVISIFALNKVAEQYGLTLSGAHLSYEDLLSIYQSTSQAKIIAHVNGNHYVVIQGITADAVTYMDPGMGADKHNEIVTLSKKEFLKVWEGNVTLESSQYSAVSNQETARLLSVEETKEIRGAFFPFFFAAIAAFVSAAATAVAAVLTAVAAIVTQVGILIGNLIVGIGQALGGILHGLGTALYQGVHFAASTLFKAASWVGTQMSQAVFGGLAKTSFGQAFLQTAVKTGVNFAVSRGLESIGVNPVITNFASAFITGGLDAGFKTGFTAANVFFGGLNGVALRGHQVLMEYLEIDPILDDTISLLASPFFGDTQSGNIGDAFVKIIPKVAKNLASYGLEKLGESLGLNPVLSAVLNVPLSNAIAAQFEQPTQYTGQPNPNQRPIKINERSYYDETQHKEIYIPGPEEGGQEVPSWWDNTLSFFRDNLSEMIEAGTSAYYATQITPIDIQNPSNLPPATTDQAPLPEGATPESYQDPFTGETKNGYRLTQSQTSYTIHDRATGETVKRVQSYVTEEGAFEYRLIKKSDGTFMLDQRQAGYLTEGNLQYETPQGGEITFKIHEKEVQEIRLEVESPDIVLDPNTIGDDSGRILEGIIQIATIGLTLYVSDGEVSKDGQGNGIGSEELTKKLTTAFVFGNGFENEWRPENTPDPLMGSFIHNLEDPNQDNIINSLRKFVVDLYEETKLVANGVDWIGDFGPENTQLSEQLRLFIFFLKVGGKPVEDFFKTRDNLDGETFFQLLPEVDKQKANTWFQRVKNWYLNKSGLGNDLVLEVVEELEALQWGRPAQLDRPAIEARGPLKDSIAFTHSGFTAPLLTAIEWKKYDIQTVIMYEGPHPNYFQQFTNPHLKRIIHVQGTGTLLDGDAPVPFLGDAHFRGGVESINIHIKGAFHSDYSYDEFTWDEKIANAPPSAKAALQKEKERNRRVNLFMRDLYRAALSDQTTSGDLMAFLRGTAGIVFNSGRQIWEVDPELLDQ